MEEENISASLKDRINKARSQPEATADDGVSSLKTRIANAREPQEPETPRLKTLGETFRLRDVERSFQQGAFFGFSDEIEAAGRALWDRLPGEDFGDAYLRKRNNIRAEMESFSEDHPTASLGTEMLGGLSMAGTGTIPAVARGATVMSRVGRGFASGTVAGTVFGAGKAEELENVPGEATQGAAFGGFLGATVPVVIPPILHGAKSLFSGARSLFNPASGAARRLGQALERDDMTPEQISGALEEAKSLGKPATVADVGGEALKRELETAVQRPGPSAQVAEKFLADRNKEQLSRLSNDLVQGTGVKAEAIEDVITKTMRLRSKAADPVYKEAMNFAAELNDDIVNAWRAAVETPLGKQAKNHARKILNVEKFDEAPLMERIDAFKRGLDVIMQKEKGNAIGRQAQKMKTNEEHTGLVDLVDDVNPLYKKARKIWEDKSNYLDAIERGREVLKPSFTAAKLKHEFAELGDSEQEAFRIGVVDSVITRMRQQSAQEPNLVKILRSPEIRDKLKAVMDPKKASELDKILDLEDAMFSTSGKVRKGSQTAQRTAAMAEQEKQLSALRGLDFLLELVISPLRTVFTRAIPAIPRMTRERLLVRQNQEIAKRLLISDADEIFQIPTRQLEGAHLEGAAIPPAIISTE